MFSTSQMLTHWSIGVSSPYKFVTLVLQFNKSSKYSIRRPPKSEPYILNALVAVLNSNLLESIVSRIQNNAIARLLLI